MPIHCPKCGKTHDVLEFETEQPIVCSCGAKLDITLYETVDDFLRYFENHDEIEKAREIQEDASEICRMILDEKWEASDIEIAKESLRQKVARMFPEKMETYTMIYEARFKRLWEQFRSGGRE